MKDSQQKKKKTERQNNFPQLSFTFFIISISMLCLIILNFDLNKRVSSLALEKTLTNFSPAPYPILNSNIPIEISAAGSIVLDSDSHVVLFSKNPTRFFSPASTTKILTAFVALDHFNLNDILTVYSDEIEGSTIGLNKGDRLTLESLLYAMMLPSSNDAAIAIAENFPGGKSAFVAEMNAKAKELGLASTHLEDPVGLMDESNITTPYDLSILGDLAMKNPQIARVVGTKNKSITTLNGKSFELTNLNILLGKDGVEGIKTGFTQTSGEVLVTSKSTKGKRSIIVVMQSENRFGDTEKIMQRLDSGLSYQSIQP